MNSVGDLLLFQFQPPDYRPKCVSGGLVVRLPFDPGVEVVPVDAGAVSCGGAERLVLALRAPFPCLPAEALESFVGHRVGREPRVGLGMRRVLMAPPADRLQPSDQPQCISSSRCFVLGVVTFCWTSLSVWSLVSVPDGFRRRARAGCVCP